MKGLLLISGGIDSAVAGNIMMQQGLELIGIHFSSEPFTNDEPEQKSIKLCKLIGIKKLLVVDAGRMFADIAKKAKHRYYYIITKRLMIRLAEAQASKHGCTFLVTGDNLGQVSSQTLDNLAIIAAAPSMTVFRPLLCYDKFEIIKKAIALGTFEISKGPEMCSVLGPKSPSTKATSENILQEESMLDMNSLIAHAAVKEIAV